MTLYPIESGNFKLDGGAMFGVVPKTIWQKTNPADQNNRIDIGARCLLIENNSKLILIDTGMGNKQSDKFFSYYAQWGDYNLIKSLKAKGFHPDDITDVFLTHLHFDHCGGAVSWNSARTGYELTFKNANYWTNQAHWEWATKPNAREKASFLVENLKPIKDSGQLKFLNVTNEGLCTLDDLGFDAYVVNGHTEKQMLPVISYQNKTLCFAADLIPTCGHIPLPYVMGYDTRPLVTLKEKQEFLQLAHKNNYYLFLEHDAHNEVIDLKMTEKGIRLQNTYNFEQLF